MRHTRLHPSTRAQDIAKRARQDHLETVAMLAASFTAATACIVLGVIVSLWSMGVMP